MVALGAIALGAVPAAAQAGGGMAFGIKGGALFSTASVSDDDGIDIGTYTSFGGGVFLSIPLGGVHLQPEALYLRKGASLSGEEVGDGDLDLHLDYVEVPVLLVVPLGTGTGASPYVFGGGAVAVEAGCEFTGEAEGISVTVDCDGGDDVDLEFERKKVDVGAVVGAGLRFPAGSGHVLLEGRYTFGLTNISDSGDDEDSFKNRSGAVFVGYSFPIGG
jgi:hypothetical protein